MGLFKLFWVSFFVKMGVQMLFRSINDPENKKHVPNRCANNSALGIYKIGEHWKQKTPIRNLKHFGVGKRIRAIPSSLVLHR